MFHDVVYPDSADQQDLAAGQLTLRRLKRYLLPAETVLSNTTLVVFDLETTGLDHGADRIIEIGGFKYLNGNKIDEFHSLVHTDIERTEENIKLTGITSDMLQGQPLIDEVLPRFLQFIEGGVLVAHNAEFDIGMIKAAAGRMAIDLEWPCFCTMKMAQKLLQHLERKTLDHLAGHYGLRFEERHRAVGDIKVLGAVLQRLLTGEAQSYQTWGSLKDFHVC